MKQMIVPMEIKTVGLSGEFSGYASIFGNVDLGGDIISKNKPFKEIVTNSEGKVVTLFQHDSRGWTASGGLPVALSEVTQNSVGLKFDGQLIMEDPFVQRVHTHMKAKSLTGMSIGYDVLPGGAKILESGVRELNALKLWEISVVTFGMNPKAGIDSVKQANQITNIREYEDFLRDVGGFSRAQAKLLAVGWKSLPDQRDADGEDTAANYLKFLQSIPEKIQS